MNTFTVTDIVWDTEDAPNPNLPSTVTIHTDLNEEDIADILSDEYGWAVISFNY